MTGLKRMYLEYLIIRKKYKPELNKAIYQNFIYGILWGITPTFIATGLDIAIIISLLVYSSYLSIIFNRDKYKTVFGRHILFPGMFTIGGYLGYKFAKIISLWIQ